MVPRVGLEPTRREARDPKSRMSTNSITSAKQSNYILILIEAHNFDQAFFNIPLAIPLNKTLCTGNNIYQ